MTLDEIYTYSYTHPVVAYDGTCILCNSFIKRLLHLDKRAHLRYASIQSNTGISIAKKTGVDSILFVEDGVLFTKSTAILHISKHLPAPHSYMYIFHYIPRLLRDSIYDVIARNRYRLLGKTDTCALPDAKYTDRFLV